MRSPCESCSCGHIFGSLKNTDRNTERNTDRNTERNTEKFIAKDKANKWKKCLPQYLDDFCCALSSEKIERKYNFCRIV